MSASGRVRLTELTQSLEGQFVRLSQPLRAIAAVSLVVNDPWSASFTAVEGGKVMPASMGLGSSMKKPMSCPSFRSGANAIPMA